MGSDLSVYALAGVRRLAARFRVDCSGCLSLALYAADEFTAGTDIHDEDFIGWTAGAGLEKRLGNAAIRGKVRYTDYESSERVVPYDDLAITVPLRLEADGVGVLVSLLWGF